MKNLMKGLVFGALGLSVLAQTTASTAATSANSTTTTAKSVLQKLKDSPFSMFGIVESSMRQTEIGEGNDVTNYLYLYPGYKLNDTISFRVVPSFRYNITGENQSEEEFDYQSVQARVYVKMLNEKDHGVRLTTQVRNYIYQGSTRGTSGYSSKHRIYPIFGKKLSNKWSLSVPMFAEFYNNNSHAFNAVKYNLFVSASTTYSINDKWSITQGIEYYDRKAKSQASKINDLYITPIDIGYSFNSNVSLNVSYGTTIMANNDGGATFANQPLKNGNIIASLFVNMF